MEMDNRSDDYYAYDYNMTAHEEDCEVQQSAALGPIRAVLYSVIMAIGVPGNVVLLVALWHRRWGRVNTASPWRGQSCTTSEILAANLAVSDLLFLGSLPLWIDAEVSGGAWRGGATGCKLAPYVTALNMHGGVWLITFMSIDRYLAVACRSHFSRARRRCLVMWSCAFTWASSVFLALPVLHSRVLLQEGPHNTSYCREPESHRQLSPAASLSFLLITFFLPLFIIVFCYSSLIRVLGQHLRGPASSLASGHTPLRHSMRIVLWVVAAFILSWLPYSTCRLLGSLSRCLTPGDASCRLQQVALVGLDWTIPLAFANSCVNPLLFGAAAQRGRQAACCLNPCRVDIWTMTWGHTGSSTHTSPSTWDSIEGGQNGRRRR